MGNSSSGRSWPRDVRDLFRGGGNATRSSRRQRDPGAAGHSDRRHHGGDDRRRHADSAAETAAHRAGGTTQRDGGGRRTNYNKLDSCPDLQTAARTGGLADQQRRLQKNDAEQQQPLKLNVKIYRSYRSHSVVRPNVA